MKEEKRNKKLIEKKNKKIHEEMLFRSYQARKETKIAPKGVCISLQNINKIYPNHVQAVYDFNLDIKDKEFIVFVGPSGCGKSTTLRMIAGLEDITFGDLYINNKYANELLPKQRDVAMVFQNYALYPNMTVYDNIAFSLKILHIDKQEIKERVMKAAKMLDIVNYLDRKPSALSGGQRQRVALGRAIVRDAKVFLMDEPLSNLDAKLRVAMRSEIVNLHKEIGSTTIYVTHDQTEAMTMASRIVVMKDGIIQQIGTPRDIYNNPTNLFVATFIGAPAMNIISVNFDGKNIILPNSYKIKLSQSQIEKINQFNLDNINAAKTKIEEIKQQIVNREFELSHLGYEKDMELYKRKVVKLTNLVRTYERDLEEAIANKKDQEIVDEIMALSQTAKENASAYKQQRLLEIENKQYKVVDENKLKEKENSDAIYILLNKELQEEIKNLEEYENHLQSNEFELFFGIRPENLLDERLASLSENHSDALELKITLSELLGDQYYLHTQIGDTSIIAKSSTEKNISSGDTVKLYIDLNKFYLFDKKSSKKII